MPLFADLPAGSANEGHRHGTAHGADFLSVRGLAVGTDDTLATGEVLLLFAGGLLCFYSVLFVKTSHFLTMRFAFAFYYAWIGEVTEIITIPTKKMIFYF